MKLTQPTNNLKLLWKQFCLQNDKKAFELFFYQLNSSLINFCNGYIHNQEAAEEIVSDVFVNCWINRQRLTAVENPKNYVYVAVKNKSLNYLKKYSQLQLVPLAYTEEFFFIDSADPNRELEKKEFFFRMDQIVGKLPQQGRQVFRLIKEDGMQYKEVAELLDISPRTVQTHLSRAIKKLSETLRDHLQKENTLLRNKLFFLFLFSQIF